MLIEISKGGLRGARLFSLTMQLYSFPSGVEEMRAAPLTLVAFFLVSTASLSQAQVDVEVREADGNLFTLIGTGQELAGMDFQSPAGRLIPAADASPFLFLLANTSNAVTYAVIPGTVRIDGEVKLNSGYNGRQPEIDSDLAAVAGIGGEQGGPGTVTYVPLPEPATGLTATFCALGMLGFRRRRSVVWVADSASPSQS